MDTKKPFANPLMVLREEFDDWAVLFDPDTGNAFGLNPVSVFIWKLLDGKHTETDIIGKLQKDCPDMPDNAQDEVTTFITELTDNGLVGYEYQEA